MTIGGWLSEATEQLVQAGIASPRLDAEIILAHTLREKRTYVHAHPADEIDLRLEEIANARLDLRLDRVPVAYIVGHKEFYGHLFKITPHVLIPRPESEEMLTLLRKIMPTTMELPAMATTKRLVDIGTGSGCLGISAKLLYPELDVTLLDTSKTALQVAEKNAAALDAEAQTLQSDLLSNYPFSPDIVLANLPYVDESWSSNSPELRHEPPEALFASKKGLSVIQRCFEELSHRMRKGGIAIFEADPRQWSEIEKIARENGFLKVDQLEYATTFKLH
ncbi:MAG TPA: HemK/PrmC family methyltransferase [Candidatus Saccharimonadales bacterium]